MNWKHAILRERINGAMHVLVIEVVLHLPWSTSLKDKRKVRYGLIDRLTRRHRISVKEVDCQGAQQTLCLGIAGVVLTGGRVPTNLNNPSSKRLKRIVMARSESGTLKSSD